MIGAKICLVVAGMALFYAVYFGFVKKQRERGLYFCLAAYVIAGIGKLFS